MSADGVLLFEADLANVDSLDAAVKKRTENEARVCGNCEHWLDEDLCRRRYGAEDIEPPQARDRACVRFLLSTENIDKLPDLVEAEREALERYDRGIEQGAKDEQ